MSETATESAPAPATPSKPETVLILRGSKNDLTSYGGFQYPESGPVEAPDWKLTAECGNGLHGLLWGHGDFGQLPGEKDAKFQIIEVEASLIVELGHKVKFPRGVVVATFNNWWQAFSYIVARRPSKATDSIAKGERASAAASGYYGHAAASGESGHAAASGYSGHAAASGEFGHAAASGNSGHAAASGYYGHAAASGEFGHAAASGEFGVAVATGKYGRAKAGPNGCVAVGWWDEKASRPRLAVGYVGEDCIERDVWYIVVDGKLERDKTQD